MTVGDSVLVSLCVNTEHGVYSGHVSAAHFDDAEGLTCLELESPWADSLTDAEPNPHPTFARRAGVIVIDGLDFPVTRGQHGVGNVFWNAYTMPLATARKLAIDLRGLGWRVVMWTTSQPFLPAEAFR